MAAASSSSTAAAASAAAPAAPAATAGGAPASAAPSRMSAFIGTKVAVSTDTEEFTGVLFAYDDASSTAVFVQAIEHTTIKSTIRMIKNSSIKEIKIVGPPTAPPAALPHISKDRVHGREADRRGVAEKRASQIGVDVTPEAQSVFDALVKTYPCHWDGKTIVVLDTTRVAPPYTAESCSGPNPTALDRVRLVVNATRAR